MKFNCDNCGAQYLIADEKLGSRGVKVRCKKCSYVIILRPDGYEPTARKNGHVAESAEREEVPAMAGATAGMSRGAPVDATLPGEIVAQTSSDFGLSQEFMALGFDDDGSPVAPSRNMSLSVGLDVNGMSDATDAHSSPFSSERTGGSLDFVPEAPSGDVEVAPMKPYGDDATEVLDHAARANLEVMKGLGHAHPQVDPTDEEENTRVEPRDDLDMQASDPGLEAPAEESGRFEPLESGLPSFDDDERTANFADATPPAQDEAPLVAAVDESDALASLAADSMAEDDAPLDEANDEYAAALDAAIAGQSGDDTPAFDGLDADAFGNTDAAQAPVASSDDILSALADVEKNEVEDMRSSIASELAGLSSEIAPFADDNAVPGETAVGAPPDTPEDDEAAQVSEGNADDNGMQAEFGALSDLDQIGEGEQLLGQDDSVEAELDDAFGAMFDGPGGPDEGFEAPPSSADDEELAALDALAAEDGNKLQTRVFDTDAMAQVEAEQQIAGKGEVVSDVREWYVAVNDEQVGPLNVNEVKAKWMTGEVGPNSLCWKQGMADWTAIRFTEGLETVRDAESAPPEPASVEDSINLGEPPQIAQQPEPEEPKPEAVAVAPTSSPAEPVDDGGWRPSAASALASLAAEELAEVSTPAVVPADVAAGPAIAATSTALEKLLEGEAKIGTGAEMFGAAEKSESAVRPLPRRADTVSSVPLRDPTVERQRQSYLVPLAILGGFLLLALTVTGTILFMSNSSTANEPGGGELAANTNPGNAAAVAKPPPPPVAPEVAPPATPPPAATNDKTDPPKDTAAAVAPPAEKPPEIALEPVKAPPKKAPPKRRKRRTKSRETVKAPPPKKAPPPPRRGVSEEDDLLGGQPKRRRRTIPEPSNDLPRQLDDSDVLSVIRKNRNAVRTCMKKQAAADPALDGTMTVRMVIRKSGRPQRVRVAPEKFKSSVVGRCVSSSVRGWKFPKFSGPSMPIDFPVRVRGS